MPRKFDLAAIRAEFPILARDVNGHPLVYLDNAASAQKPDAVLDAMAKQARTAYANVHRGLHTLANEATAAFEGARETVRGFLNAPSTDNIIFTKGSTEGINLVASALAGRIQPGDEIVLSFMEHHSNIVPWHFLRERHGAVLKLDAGSPTTASLDLGAFAEPARPEDPKIVAITHMSNVLGTVTDIRRPSWRETGPCRRRAEVLVRRLPGRSCTMAVDVQAHRLPTSTSSPATSSTGRPASARSTARPRGAGPPCRPTRAAAR
jgi:cysteine desulfurase/selenocysteine lyase